jgi:hypothetical protein
MRTSELRLHHGKGAELAPEKVLKFVWRILRHSAFLGALTGAWRE